MSHSIIVRLQFHARFRRFPKEVFFFLFLFKREVFLNDPTPKKQQQKRARPPCGRRDKGRLEREKRKVEAAHHKLQDAYDDGSFSVAQGGRGAAARARGSQQGTGPLIVSEKAEKGSEVKGREGKGRATDSLCSLCQGRPMSAWEATTHARPVSSTPIDHPFRLTHSASSGGRGIWSTAGGGG